MRVLSSLIPGLLLFVSAAVPAQAPVVIYRCTDAAGALTVQNNTPCPKGSKQDKRVIQAPPAVHTPALFVSSPVAAPTPATTPSAPRPQTASPAVGTPAEPSIADADRLPPPALYECRTYDNDRYLSDDGRPPQRCAPLQTTGLGGGSEYAAGQACQMVDDQCQRIADGALCDNWQQRLREAQSQLRFGVVGNRAQAQAEVERIGRIVRESTCGR